MLGFTGVDLVFQDMVKGLEKSREKGGDSDSDVHEALASQVVPRLNSSFLCLVVWNLLS